MNGHDLRLDSQALLHAAAEDLVTHSFHGAEQGESAAFGLASGFAVALHLLLHETVECGRNVRVVGAVDDADA